jgi:ABC-type Fe2+-enterobactin transport system substrate-binding protein
MEGIPFRRYTTHRILRLTRSAVVVAGLLLAAAAPVATVEATTSTDLVYADGQRYLMNTPYALLASNAGLIQN